MSRSRAGFVLLSPAALIMLLLTLFSGCTTTLTRSQLAVEYYNIGTAYFELGDLAKSASFLSRALELDESLAQASYNLARVHVLRGEYEAAVELLDTLARSDPDNVLIIETLAYARFLDGDMAGAATLYDQALEVSPADLDLLLNRAAVAELSGDNAGAASLLRRAYQVDPEDPTVILRLARAEVTAGERAAAIEHYDIYLETNEDDWLARFELAGLYVDAEYYGLALTQLELVVDGVTGNDDLRGQAAFLRAQVLLTAAEEEDEGIRSLQTAISLGYSDSDAIADLLAAPNLVGRDRVEALLSEAGLLESVRDGDAGAGGEAEAAPDAERSPHSPADPEAPPSNP